MDIFKSENQASAIAKINNLYDFNSAGYSVVKIPSAVGGVGRFFGYKDDTLMIKGPNGGFLSQDDFDKGELVEYGGDSGNKATRDVKPLKLDLNLSHNSAEGMLERLRQLAELAGVKEKTTSIGSNPLG